jgi:hypothetical protein
MGFRDDFDDLSHSKNHNATQTARQYLCGPMKAERRNMERVAEAVPDSDDRVLQAAAAGGSEIDLWPHSGKLRRSLSHRSWPI